MLILCKKCAEVCWRILFQQIQYLFFNFQRNQRKSCIISAHLADFLHKYPLTAADPCTREWLTDINAAQLIFRIFFWSGQLCYGYS